MMFWNNIVKDFAHPVSCFVDNLLNWLWWIVRPRKKNLYGNKKSYQMKSNDDFNDHKCFEYFKRAFKCHCAEFSS